MNRSRKTVSKQLIIALGLFAATTVFAQKESRTFEERFNVKEDAVLEINTSYADIEFETWEKDEVAITATITLDGATKEEVDTYFKNTPIEILGNSTKVTVSSKSRNNNLFMYRGDSDMEFDFDNLHIDIPEIAPFVVNVPQIAPFPEMPPLPPMPPLPTTKAFKFDYEAYEKDGEKYMKKWQKNFEKSFDKEHQKKLEAWGERVEEQAKKMEERMHEQQERRAEQLDKRALEMDRRIEAREEKRAQILSEREKERDLFFVRRDSLRGNDSNIFYFNTDGAQRNYKIKKTIKIKLPKSTRIKMDVRHGEVKLAENTKNLNANLSHSSLWAVTIEGSETNVSAAYTPVNVRKWNYGQLNTKYSEAVSLAEVVELQLQATSSHVTIDKILERAFIKNSFGPLHISELGANFKELDLSLKNGELKLHLPKVATNIYIKENASSLKIPSTMKLSKTQNGSTTVNKGFHLKNDSDRSILITADYSEVVIQ